MVRLSNVSVVIPTRGDHDLSPIIDSLSCFDEILIWDNSKRQDLNVYARYAMIDEARHPLVFTQDDDCIVSDPEQIVWESSHGGSEYGRLVCNMPPEFRPHYSDSALVGFGAAFHRDLPKKAFQRISLLPLGNVDMLDINERFLRTCDVVFTALTPFTLIDVSVENLPWATADDRMYRDPNHFGERKQMLSLARKVRDS